MLGTCISPRYPFDIEVHDRVHAPHVLRELARMLALGYDTLLALVGGTDVVVREYLQHLREAGAAVIRLVRTAQQRGFHDWDQLYQRVARGREGGS